MPLAPSPSVPFPQSWTIFGHSYFQMAFGTRTQQGRPDGYFRNLLDVQQGLNIINHAQAGQRLSVLGDWGFGRVLNTVKGWTGGAGNLGNTAPYVIGGQGGSGGAYLFGFGINDVGFNGQTTQNNTAYQHALRTCISRCRISTLGSTGNNNYPGGTGTFAQSGFLFTAGSAGFATGGASNLTWTTGSGNTITLTLPSDYAGETVAICVIGTSNASSGQTLWTLSGSAGVTGTFTSDLMMPQASLNNVPVTKRITNLTAANASQTIILTVTTLGGSGIAYFDSWWLEADNPPPVIICNTARLANATGYATYANTLTSSLSGTAVASTPSTITLASGATFGISAAGTVTCPSAGGTVTITYTAITPTTLTGCSAAGGSGNYSSNTLSFPGPTDSDVVTFNAVLPSVVAEFDGMVQVADIDTALNKNVNAFSFDFLHMNELGAAKIAQAIQAAVQRLTPTSSFGTAANLNPPFPVFTPVLRPYVTGQWYTSDSFGTTSTSTTYTAVAGDIWALPIYVSSGVSVWNQWSVQEVAASAAPTVFFAIYEDRLMQGYPMTMHVQPANVNALTLLAAPGTFTSTTSTGNGFLSQAMDPGLYWLALKIVTAGTGVTFATIHGPSMFMPNLASTGASPGTGVGPVAWKLTGQGAGAMTGRFPTGAVASDNAPFIGVKVLLAQS